MRALLPAKVKRRTLSLAAAVAVAAAIVTAGLALAIPAQAAPAHQVGAGSVSVAITSMNPPYARPGATVTMTGTVSNRTGQAQPGLEVQLYTSPVRFLTRDGMDFYLAHGGNSALEPAGKPFLIPASMAPGGIARWSASLQVSTAGISEFGVYPVAAQLRDNISGSVLGADQTLLPFWPGPQAAGMPQPLSISWIWPLIDQPHRQVCAALTDNDLAASLGQGGRLAALATAGMNHADADLTWVIDPALAGDVAAMTRPYQVGSRPNCTGATPEPASKAAATWLSALKEITRTPSAVITPYADVDQTALVHRGLNADLASAFAAGERVARNVLGEDFKTTIAWPADGTADLSVLTSLAAAEHIGTVVLNSSEMPPVQTGAYKPDDAVTSIRTGTGTTMSVLLADDTLTRVLRAGNTSSGVLPPSTEFDVRQQFLAETAMIATEAPGSARTVVVAPPAGWSPSQTLAGDLLGETTSAPWLAPTPLRNLAAAPDAERTMHRQPPPASGESPGELSRGYLSRVSSLGDRLGVYKSMLYLAAPSYLQSFGEALAATESAAWRDGGASQGVTMAGNLSDYLTSAERKVKVITSAQVPMGGASGPVPVSIQNGLHQAIEVRVNVSVDNSPGRTSQLTVGRFQHLVIVPPQEAVTVRLPVSSAPIGPTLIRISLTSASGKPLPYAASLTVQSTRYGRAILFLIGAAIGVLVLTSVYRGIRRWPHDHAHAVNEEAEPPGSVVTGTSGARHPTEAPDDLADARRWADDA